MPTIEVDFETYKALVALRPSEDVSEAEVIRQALGLARGEQVSAERWVSKGVSFRVGQKLRHRFRGGRVVEATISLDGVIFGGKTFDALSPAAKSITGNEEDGWRFWEIDLGKGQWVKAHTLRHA